jgi:glucosamine--fructose-6-phosphate aminotransferase (isomerizing)
MCNMAAYLGSRRAAPLLLEMIRRQEGFAGGYSTGIATLDAGRLHWAKVVGDTDTLCRDTDAERLPGTVGIVHSRSKAGGGDEWAHPFVDCREQMAYIANGHLGCFEGIRDTRAVGERLLGEDHQFRSKSSEQIGKYPVLPDGSCVHGSEMMCHLIEALTDECGDPVQAMRRAYCTFPAEIAGLMIHAAAPDRVVATRVNQPLMAAGTCHGTCIATTAFAFQGHDCEWITTLPCNATAAVTRDRMEIFPFDSPPGKVTDVFPWAEGAEAIAGCLASGKSVAMGELKRATAPLWPEDRAPQKDMMIYEILRTMHAAGTIELTTARVEGLKPGATAPQVQARLVG